MDVTVSRRLDLFRIYKHSRKEELSEFFYSHIFIMSCLWVSYLRSEC